MYNCTNKEPRGHFHKHTTADEGRRCWFPPAAPIAASPPPPPAVVPVVQVQPSAPIHPNDQPGSISARQKKIINNKGERWEVQWSYNEAYAFIDQLFKRDRAERQKPVKDPRLDMIEGMLDLIPDGYYATAKNEGGHVAFIRLSRPVKGRYKGAIKIQSKHAERWAERLVKWPSGQWSNYRQIGEDDVVDLLLMVIADHKTCARRYSIENQSCCVCNTELTDDRSRHYLIGPICDKKPQWQHMIEQVDDLNNGMSFEELVARGLPTRVWQDRAA